MAPAVVPVLELLLQCKSSASLVMVLSLHRGLIHTGSLPSRSVAVVVTGGQAARLPPLQLTLAPQEAVLQEQAARAPQRLPIPQTHPLLVTLHLANIAVKRDQTRAQQLALQSAVMVVAAVLLTMYW